MGRHQNRRSCWLLWQPAAVSPVPLAAPWEALSARSPVLRSPWFTAARCCCYRSGSAGLVTLFCRVKRFTWRGYKSLTYFPLKKKKAAWTQLNLVIRNDLKKYIENFQTHSSLKNIFCRLVQIEMLIENT